MVEFFAELALWLRGSDREGTVILWRVTAVLLLVAAAILGLVALLA